jgi:hypothetical protein
MRDGNREKRQRGDERGQRAGVLRRRQPQFWVVVGSGRSGGGRREYTVLLDLLEELGVSAKRNATKVPTSGPHECHTDEYVQFPAPVTVDELSLVFRYRKLAFFKYDDQSESGGQV